MFNSIIVATVNKFNNGEEDKNGKLPVILNVVAGKCPNRNVLSGTVAENAGFEVGETYLIQCREIEPSEEYGRQFVYNKMKSLDVVNILDSIKQLPKAEIFAVEGTTSTTRVNSPQVQEKMD
jgi:hypothetical protein